MHCCLRRGAKTANNLRCFSIAVCIVLTHKRVQSPFAEEFEARSVRANDYFVLSRVLVREVRVVNTNRGQTKRDAEASLRLEKRVGTLILVVQVLRIGTQERVLQHDGFSHDLHACCCQLQGFLHPSL